LRIAINTRFLLPTKMEGFGWYTYEVTKRLVEMHPEHTFIFFFDRAYDPKFIFGKNVEPVVVNPPARHPILFYIWFEWSIKRALKKHKADLFFSPDGYLSLGSDVKQIGVIHDINFEHHPEDLPKSALNYLKKYFPKFAKKADHIITVSDYSKQDICQTYQIKSDKITSIWNGASDAFQPISSSEKETIKEQYTGGSEYFLFVGALHPRKNVIRLLQAFDRFKKTTTSDVKLVIVGEALWGNPTFNTAISEQYQSEVIFTGHLSLDKLTKIMAAAKVFTFVPYFEGFGIPLVEAMKCGTPVLAGNKTSLPEIGGDAVAYCDPYDVEDIAKQLIELDSNEVLRNQLSEKGLERSKQFSWDNCAKQVSKLLGL